MIHLLAAYVQEPRCIDCDGWGPEALVPSFRTFCHAAGVVIAAISMVYAFVRRKSGLREDAIPGAFGCASGVAVFIGSYRLSDKGFLLALGIVYGSGLVGVVTWVVFSFARLLTRTFRRFTTSLHKDTL